MLVPHAEHLRDRETSIQGGREERARLVQCTCGAILVVRAYQIFGEVECPACRSWLSILSAWDLAPVVLHVTSHRVDLSGPRRGDRRADIRHKDRPSVDAERVCPGKPMGALRKTTRWAGEG